ncbi:MAG: hypothetical protein R3C69_04155 [Geminicoccaceae bacterium]
MDLDAYAADLCRRFANPAIGHETRQIARDGTEKLPQRVMAPALELARRGGELRPFAFAVAVWMRYAIGRTDAGETYAVEDPRAAEIRAAVASGGTPAGIARALHGLQGLFPPELVANAAWTGAVTAILAGMLERGVATALAGEAAGTA